MYLEHFLREVGAMTFWVAALNPPQELALALLLDLALLLVLDLDLVLGHPLAVQECADVSISSTWLCDYVNKLNTCQVLYLFYLRTFLLLFFRPFPFLHLKVAAAAANRIPAGAKW